MAKQGQGKRFSRRLILPLIVVFACLAVIVFRQNIYDWWRLREYTPTSEISQIVHDTALTDKGQRIFYAAHPSIEDSAAFNQHCSGATTKASEKTIVLGCYTGRNIYIYNVTDQRLKGVKEVTSAHEMLHAAYERLSTKQKDTVNEMLNKQFKDMNDLRITDVLNEYKKSEPNDLLNEMHSIFGTELAQLNPELEAYYKQYFEDRSKVVALAQTYEGIFVEGKVEIATIDQQLLILGGEIAASKEQLDIQKQNLETQRQELEKTRDESQPEEYNARVTLFNDSVEAYNEYVRLLQERVAQYNGLVEKRNTLAAAANDLAKGLDSHVTPLNAE